MRWTAGCVRICSTRWRSVNMGDREILFLTVDLKINILASLPLRVNICFSPCVISFTGTGSISISILPASTFDRSSISLIRFNRSVTGIMNNVVANSIILSEITDWFLFSINSCDRYENTVQRAYDNSWLILAGTPICICWWPPARALCSLHPASHSSSFLFLLLSRFAFSSVLHWFAAILPAVRAIRLPIFQAFLFFQKAPHWFAFSSSCCVSSSSDWRWVFFSSNSLSYQPSIGWN